MNTSDRRREIINILIIRRHTTAKELAEELGVTARTIRNDIQALSPEFPIYTQQGVNGGIYIGEEYRPYNNTLTSDELHILCEMHKEAEGMRKRILFQIIQKYGPDKFVL